MITRISLGMEYFSAARQRLVGVQLTQRHGSFQIGERPIGRYGGDRSYAARQPLPQHHCGRDVRVSGSRAMSLGVDLACQARLRVSVQS